ncbi:DNA (cytosine-5)-methyltransferase 1 [Labrenzia sp. EL_208]|nr:DNA (cytosine-5)-methyltransferase 1 [Labrenzia sp. EL_132]MBG6226845.1 DNA (cytosine-5)-methyltransferase 1 [Labrenzia sp. EL_208]
MEELEKPIAVDLFAGAGGFSLGAIRSGFNVAFAVENDVHSAATYRENICKKFGDGQTKLFDADIETLDPLKLRADFFTGRSCDLLLGGPPCQGFSTHRILDAGVDDPRNKLILAYFNFVKILRPRVFLMENVPGILWARHKSYMNRFYTEGKAAGYRLFDPVTLDARDFGVPQRRRRVFVLGVREDTDCVGFNWPPEPTHGDPRKIEDGRIPWQDCSKVFEVTCASDVNDVNMSHGVELVEVFRNTPANGGSRKDSGRILPCHQEHDGHKDVYGRIDPSQPAPTMTTACINPSKGRFVHPTEHHGITARQAARIQTFPDHFVFSGGLMAAGRQIGNAVPVKLAAALLGHIRSHLDRIDTSSSCSSLPSSRKILEGELA